MKNTWMVVLAVSVLALTGCAKRNKVQVDASLPPPPDVQAGASFTAAPLPPPPVPSGQTYVPPPAPVRPIGAVEAPAAPAAAGQQVHEVQKGETLWKITAKYYGKSSAAGMKKIMDANPELTDPNKIQVGQKLIIPD